MHLTLASLIVRDEVCIYNQGLHNLALRSQVTSRLLAVQHRHTSFEGGVQGLGLTPGSDDDLDIVPEVHQIHSNVGGRSENSMKGYQEGANIIISNEPHCY